MPQLELYGSAQCPYTQELREWLEWTRREFHEYNVDVDPDAYARLQSFTGGSVAVPVLVEDGKVAQIGWQGRSCVIGFADAKEPWRRLANRYPGDGAT